MAFNLSEQKAEFLSKKSFLSLWCFPNPVRKDNNNELCDLLVVYGNDLIIFSVKELNIKETSDLMIDLSRWERRALDNSFDQIYGAERTIKNGIIFIYSDKEFAIQEIEKKNIYRVAVVIGRGEKFHIKYGDMGNGFVHVLDEKSLDIVMGELDTISDFIEYLKNKEEFFGKNKKIIARSEEDILAVYLQNGRKFSEDLTKLMIGNVWEEFSAKEEFIRRKKSEKVSYVWDGIIESFSSEFREKQLYTPFGISNPELILRTIASENRFNRRMLSESLTEFVYKFDDHKSESRMTISPSDIVYVFLQMNIDENDQGSRQYRNQVLALRCFVARVMNSENKTVIGLASEFRDGNKKYSYDLCYLSIPFLTDEHRKKARQIQDEFGFYKASRIANKEIDEYPK